jgi:hypothetical protein
MADIDISSFIFLCGPIYVLLCVITIMSEKRVEATGLRTEYFITKHTKCKQKQRRYVKAGFEVYRRDDIVKYIRIKKIVSADPFKRNISANAQSIVPQIGSHSHSRSKSVTAIQK